MGQKHDGDCASPPKVISYYKQKTPVIDLGQAIQIEFNNKWFPARALAFVQEGRGLKVHLNVLLKNLKSLI